jgi:hypothetical protein
MCHIGGQVETVKGAHASREIVELVLSKEVCESRHCAYIVMITDSEILG